MTVYLREKRHFYPEKAEELAELLEMVKNHIESNPELHTNLKSFKVYSNIFGEYSCYTILWEFDGAPEMWEWIAGIRGNEEWHDTIHKKLFEICIPETAVSELWGLTYEINL